MNKSEIENWLKKYKITNYTIHPNLVVDVDDNVDIHAGQLEALPFQFGKVTGDFICSENNLTSLQHCPTTVGGSFNCFDNNLTSLQYCPTTVGGNFYCGINKLTSLEYCPTEVHGNFYCFNNPFEVTPKDYASWIKAIKLSKNVYPQIEKQATPDMKACHKLLWEL